MTPSPVNRDKLGPNGKAWYDQQTDKDGSFNSAEAIRAYEKRYGGKVVPFETDYLFPGTFAKEFLKMADKARETIQAGSEGGAAKGKKKKKGKGKNADTSSSTITSNEKGEVEEVGTSAEAGPSTPKPPSACCNDPTHHDHGMDEKSYIFFLQQYAIRETFLAVKSEKKAKEVESVLKKAKIAGKAQRKVIELQSKIIANQEKQIEGLEAVLDKKEGDVEGTGCSSGATIAKQGGKKKK